MNVNIFHRSNFIEGATYVKAHRPQRNLRWSLLASFTLIAALNLVFWFAIYKAAILLFR